MKNISTKFAFIIIAFFSFLAVTFCFELYIIAAKRQIAVHATNHCPSDKIDTIYNMVTDIRWERNDNLPLVVVNGCPVNQEVVILRYWNPIVEHSELLTNYK